MSEPVGERVADAALSGGRPPGGTFAAARRSRWPKLRPDVVAVVFGGGCVGGCLRYVVTSAPPSGPGRFPWGTFGVNTAGAFILTLVVVLAAEVTPSRYLRPLVGTGFCGALTTFSSVVVAVDRFVAAGQLRLAIGYLLATAVAGLTAGALGLVVGRAIAAHRLRVGERGSDRERGAG